MIKNLLALSAAVAMMGAPAAFAQTAAPPTTGPAAPALNSSASASGSMGSTGAAAKVAAGLTVKDKTGVAIGTISEVKPGPDGAELATVKMGAQTFSVAASSLGVADGAATINATQAEVLAMIKGAGS